MWILHVSIWNILHVNLTSEYMKHCARTIIHTGSSLNIFLLVGAYLWIEMCIFGSISMKFWKGCLSVFVVLVCHYAFGPWIHYVAWFSFPLHECINSLRLLLYCLLASLANFLVETEYETKCALKPCLVLTKDHCIHLLTKLLQFLICYCLCLFETLISPDNLQSTVSVIFIPSMFNLFLFVTQLVPAI